MFVFLEQAIPGCPGWCFPWESENVSWREGCCVMLCSAARPCLPRVFIAVLRTQKQPFHLPAELDL